MRASTVQKLQRLIQVFEKPGNHPVGTGISHNNFIRQFYDQFVTYHGGETVNLCNAFVKGTDDKQVPLVQPGSDFRSPALVEAARQNNDQRLISLQKKVEDIPFQLTVKPSDYTSSTFNLFKCPIIGFQNACSGYFPAAKESSA